MDKVKNKKLKFRFLICGFTFFLLLFTLNCFAQGKIVAIVNNDVITEKDLNDFVNFMRIQLSEEFKGKELESKIQSMKLDLLDKLIEDRLILQEANKNKLALDKARIAAKINEMKSRYASEGEFQNVLKRQGLVQADLEAKIKEQLLMYSVIEAEVRAKIIVNPTEVTDFYQKNTQEFIFPEQREFVYLTVKDERLIKEISKDLRANNDLDVIAKKYSLEVNKMSARKNHELREEIEKGIFNLKVREVSKPIKDENIFYIFKLINIIAPRQQSLSEVQDEIYNFLYEKKMQEGLSSWLDALKKNAYVKILSD